VINRNVIAVAGTEGVAQRTEWPIKETLFASADGIALERSLNSTLPYQTLWGVIFVITSGRYFLFQSELIFSLNGKPVCSVPVEIKQKGTNDTTDVETSMVACALTSGTAPIGPDSMLIESSYPPRYAVPHRVFCHADKMTWKISRIVKPSITLFELSLVLRQSNIAV
jgi:hypothetical protein